MPNEVDILENEIRDKFPDVLDILLLDQTRSTKSKPRNIFWATDNYKQYGPEYFFDKPIKKELITGRHGNMITPRIKKSRAVQKSRSKGMAEVFTPAWVCNLQNNVIDSRWFDREEVFNREFIDENGKHKWETTTSKIQFPVGEQNKTWRDYIDDTRLEITCGEAPYLTSRYDTTTGETIATENRIGLLDRKLRVVNENCDTVEEWLDAAKDSMKAIYGFEWQGDSLLIARESCLYAILDNYRLKFGEKELPPLDYIKEVAVIISWNIWQMDGLKGVVPNSCKSKTIEVALDLFDDPTSKPKTKTEPCPGCAKNDFFKHNGIYCKIRDWKLNKTEKFIDSLKKEPMW
ncbi:MAG: restriction endonuclease subunit M [Fibrobacteraceae bacterium]|nr:restriction endonuclease subunit M [Fibrobacteraceae bacterium]